ncbi:MAG: hypothetical protein RBT11_08670 [Desulfobacterales bacterium]|nr:hypothetical protein [Desulfobacterales bacterium]
MSPLSGIPPKTGAPASARDKHGVFGVFIKPIKRLLKWISEGKRKAPVCKN